MYKAAAPAIAAPALTPMPAPMATTGGFLVAICLVHGQAHTSEACSHARPPTAPFVDSIGISTFKYMHATRTEKEKARPFLIWNVCGGHVLVSSWPGGLLVEIPFVQLHIFKATASWVVTIAKFTHHMHSANLA